MLKKCPSNSCIFHTGGALGPWRLSRTRPSPCAIHMFEPEERRRSWRLSAPPRCITGGARHGSDAPPPGSVSRAPSTTPAHDHDAESTGRTAHRLRQANRSGPAGSGIQRSGTRVIVTVPEKVNSKLGPVGIHLEYLSVAKIRSKFHPLKQVSERIW